MISLSPALRRQKGAVLITATIVSLMAAMLTSTSLRSSTYAISMARAHIEHAAIERAARFALNDIIHRGRFSANRSLVELHYPAPDGVSINAKITRIGEASIIPLEAYHPIRDNDLRVLLYEIEVAAVGPLGYRTARGATLFHIASATQENGDLPRRLDIAQSRFGKSWWINSWRHLP